MKECKGKSRRTTNRKPKDWLRPQESLKQKEWTCNCSRILAPMMKWLNQHLNSILYKDRKRQRNSLTSLNRLELRHHSKAPFLTLHRHAELVAHHRHLSNHVSRREKRKKLFAVQNGLQKLLNKPPRKQLGKWNLSASGSRKSSKRLNVWSENAKKPSQDEPKSNEAKMS